MTDDGEETTELGAEVDELVEQSERIDDDRTEFERWEATDSGRCSHEYADRDVAYLKQWDKFTEAKTSAKSLSVCRKCGFIPEKPRY